MHRMKEQRRTNKTGVGYTIYSKYLKVKTCNERNRIEKNKKKGFREN